MPLFSHRRASPPSGNVSHYFTTRFFVGRSCQSFGSNFIGVLSNATFSNPLQSLHLCAIRSDSLTVKCAGFIGAIGSVSCRKCSRSVPQHVDASKGWRVTPPPGLANGSHIDTAISVMRLLYLQLGNVLPRASFEKNTSLFPLVALFTSEWSSFSEYSSCTVDAFSLLPVAFAQWLDRLSRD